MKTYRNFDITVKGNPTIAKDAIVPNTDKRSVTSYQTISREDAFRAFKSYALAGGQASYEWENVFPIIRINFPDRDWQSVYFDGNFPFIMNFEQTYAEPIKSKYPSSLYYRNVYISSISDLVVPMFHVGQGNRNDINLVVRGDAWYWQW